MDYGLLIFWVVLIALLVGGAFAFKAFAKKVTKDNEAKKARLEEQKKNTELNPQQEVSTVPEQTASLKISIETRVTEYEIKQRTEGMMQPFPAEWIGGFKSESGGYVNYNKYQLHGINPKTGRKNKFECNAFSEEDAIALAKEKKGLVEPFEVSIIPHDPPTESQIAYADDLEILRPDDCCKEDMSALISRVMQDDEKPASESMVKLAKSRKLMFSRFIGERALVDYIDYSINGHVRDYDNDDDEEVEDEDL